MMSSIALELPGTPRFHPSRVVSHGLILGAPYQRPAGTTGNVAYELGYCVQLDPDHALLVASLDEQGGGDLCVGNDAYVFKQLSDIRPECAIPVNRVDTSYKMRDGRTAFLAKFPAKTGFIPLGAKLPGGESHPAAGTGFLLSSCVTFSSDKTSALKAPETFIEMINIRWDGNAISFSEPAILRELHGLPLNGDTGVTQFCPHDKGLLVPMGITKQGICVFYFEWDGEKWQAISHGTPFCTNPGSTKPALPGEPWAYTPGESEASLRRSNGRYFLFARGTDPVGRLYGSSNGLDYRLLCERASVTVPQVLNQGLDGSLYLATNPGPGWLRNPLVAYDPTGEESDGLILHDQEGIRDDQGSSIPFVDHAISVNVQLEGRKRHLLFYRVCDLKERTLHKFQIDEGQHERLYGEAGPISKRRTTGLYLIELEFSS